MLQVQACERCQLGDVFGQSLGSLSCMSRKHSSETRRRSLGPRSSTLSPEGSAAASTTRRPLSLSGTHRPLSAMPRSYPWDIWHVLPWTIELHASLHKSQERVSALAQLLSRISEFAGRCKGPSSLALSPMPPTTGGFGRLSFGGGLHLALRAPDNVCPHTPTPTHGRWPPLRPTSSAWLPHSGGTRPCRKAPMPCGGDTQTPIHRTRRRMSPHVGLARRHQGQR